MVRPRGRDCRSVNNADQDPDHVPQQSDDIPPPTSRANGNVGQSEEPGILSLPDKNVEQFQHLVLLTESINKLRQQVNADRQARCDDPAHTAAVLDDEPEEPLPVSSILPTVPTTSADATHSHADAPGVQKNPVPNVNAPGFQNNGPSSARLILDAARLSWENRGAEDVFDLQNVGQIFSDEATFKNALEMDWDLLPEAILHMLASRIYISLSLLTTVSLDRIQLNQNVKYR